MVTVRLKAGSAALKLPSLTLITMPEVVPTSLLPGVPVKAPVLVLKLAQLGLLLMLKLNVSSSGSDAVGVKLYGASCDTVVAGEPLMLKLKAMACCSAPKGRCKVPVVGSNLAGRGKPG